MHLLRVVKKFKGTGHSSRTLSFQFFNFNIAEYIADLVHCL